MAPTTSVNYTIRVKEEDVREIEEARAKGYTMVQVLKAGVKAILDES